MFVTIYVVSQWSFNSCRSQHVWNNDTHVLYMLYDYLKHSPMRQQYMYIRTCVHVHTSVTHTVRNTLI